MNKESLLKNIAISNARLLNNKDKKFNYDVNWTDLPFDELIESALTLFHVAQMQQISVMSLNIQRNLEDLTLVETMVELFFWRIARSKCPFLSTSGVKDSLNGYDFDFSLSAVTGMMTKLNKIKLLIRVPYKELNEYQQEMTKDYKAPKFVYMVNTDILPRGNDQPKDFLMEYYNKKQLNDFTNDKIGTAAIANPLGEVLEKFEEILLLCPKDIREQFASKIFPDDNN